VSIHAQRAGKWVDSAGLDNIDHAPRSVKKPLRAIYGFFSRPRGTIVIPLAATLDARLERAA
jgi:hypothetical protein